MVEELTHIRKNIRGLKLGNYTKGTNWKRLKIGTPVESYAEFSGLDVEMSPTFLF